MSGGPGERDLPERDPLADLVARSIGARVDAVRVEELPGGAGVERKRLRYATSAGEASALFLRGAKGQSTEARLVPFLARKTDRVPVVHARGLPPPRAALGPWLLTEDVLAGEPACDGDVGDVVLAKLAVERAVAGDAPALRALGIADHRGGLPDGLAAAPRGLLHGDLRCAAAWRVARGVVITDWSRATIGPVVLDVATLIADLEAHGRADGARRAREAWLAAGARDGALLALAERYLRGEPAR